MWVETKTVKKVSVSYLIYLKQRGNGDAPWKQTSTSDISLLVFKYFIHRFLKSENRSSRGLHSISLFLVIPS